MSEELIELYRKALDNPFYRKFGWDYNPLEDQNKHSMATKGVDAFHLYIEYIKLNTIYRELRK